MMETKKHWSAGTLCVSDPVSPSSFRRAGKPSLAASPSCHRAVRPPLTTLQREIFRFVMIIVSLALILAILVIILWAAC